MQPASPRRTNTRLLPTLLDRLQDNAPQQPGEAAGAPALTRAQMRDIVLRDLAFLLNTTSLENQIDRTRYPLAAASTVNFGVPALAGTYLISRKWPDLEPVIRRALRDFEPRLLPDTLSISPLGATHTATNGGESAADQYNVLRFEIRGMVHMEPYPLEFLVQSSIDLETSRMTLAGDA